MAAADPRRMGPLRLESHWASLDAAECEGCERVLRDGSCHEAVMWLVHHVPGSLQMSVFGGSRIPMLPERFHRPDAVTGPGAEMVMSKYRQQFSCAACHMTGPALPAGSDPLAPKWPAPLPSQLPQQFEADVWGWQVGGPYGSFNYTGRWHYDFNANRFRQDVLITQGPAAGMRMVQLWLASPAPDEEDDAESVYGPAARRGNLYIFMTPAPGVPTICSETSYGMSIPHPDVIAFGPEGSAPHPNVTFFGREFVDGQWADHYGLWFNHSGGVGNCSGPFQIWRSIYDSVPVMDYGMGNCEDPAPLASTHWANLTRGAPALSHFQSNFSGCAPAVSAAALAAKAWRPFLGSDADIFVAAGSATASAQLPWAGKGRGTDLVV